MTRHAAVGHVIASFRVIGPVAGANDGHAGARGHACLRLVGGGAAARDAADTSARRAAMQQVLLGFPLTLCMEWMHTEVRSNLSNGLCIESLSRLGSLRFENL